MTEDARADASWLALREPADGRARSRRLVERLRAHLPREGLRVHDLGCGTGSMARWLAPRLDAPQHWVLCDRDVELLPEAEAGMPARARDGSSITCETRLGDITRLSDGPTGAGLIVASALLDMMTAPELERLTEVIATAGCPALIALSVTGRVELSPTGPLDREVEAAFNDHQRRPLRGQPLLGPDAVDAAARALRGRGLEVILETTPWHLGPEDSDLAAAWFRGWFGAAVEQRPSLAERARDYAERRRAEVADGGLRVTVHHEDLLALPRRG